MFDELHNLAANQIGKFSDSVRDEFGQSMLSEVFEPLLKDIWTLLLVAELFQTRAAEIDQLITELQSKGHMGHE